MDKYVGSSIYSTSVAGIMMMMMMMMIISSVLNARFMELLTGFRAYEVIRTISFFFRC